MKLFTITALTIALVAGFAGVEYLQKDQKAVAFWCGKIHDEETVQHQIFHDWEAVPLPECEALRQKAEAKGEGIVARTLEKVALFVLPRSRASTPE